MQRTAAELFADMFDAYGVTHVFFVPTILINSLYRMEQRTSIKRIMPHGEKPAAYMADGYARASGRPGICMAQTIGAANLAAGLRDGYMASSPIIAITGGPYPRSHDRHQYQQIDDYPLFQPVTKWSTRAVHAGEIDRVVRQAFRAATSDRPGPVHIQMLGHQGETLEHEPTDVDVLSEPRFARTPPFRPAPEPADVEAAAAMLAQARQPVIVIGGGARTSGAGPAIAELAERLSIPMVASLDGKAVVPASHPLMAGVCGLYSREAANRVLAGADLVFFVGSKTGSQVTHSWRLPRPGTAVIQCDISAQDVGLNYPNAASLVGDAKACVEALLAALGATEPDRSAWVAEVDRITGAWREQWSELMGSDAVPIRPERLCAELSSALPGDAVVVADTGHAGMWTGGFLDLNAPDQDYIRAAGSLGWAFPAALGAKCALPDRPVVAFCGDGGFWYHVAELETAARWGINAVIVVNNNNAYNQEIGLWTGAYEGELHGQHAQMWTFTEVDFTKVAQSMGVAGFRVTKASEFPGALDAALSVDGPAVVEVVTELWARAPAAWAP